MAQKGDDKRSEKMRKNKNAKIAIDWDRIDDLLSIACTGEEIASVLKIDADTLCNHCKREKGCLFSDYIKNGINEGFKVSLRRTQRMVALGFKDNNGIVHPPSTAMLIWLGKQWLGQSDKQELSGTGGKQLIPDNKIECVFVVTDKIPKE
jgi:hypothetical protein